jgi:hypothetical protein
MFRRKTLLKLAGLVVLLGLLGSASAAQARTPDAGRSATRGRHCIVRIDPVRPGQTVSTMSDLACFATFSDAIAAATGGAVHLSSTTAPTQLTEAMLAPATTTTQTVIGVDYVNTHYGGNTLTWYTTYGNCTSTNYYNAASMPSGWNDVVSSAHAWANCNHWYHYEHINYGGARATCTCYYIGDAMNDRTSSEKWRV